jgi:hypothetical protein
MGREPCLEIYEVHWEKVVSREELFSNQNCFLCSPVLGLTLLGVKDAAGMVPLMILMKV